MSGSRVFLVKVYSYRIGEEGYFVQAVPTGGIIQLADADVQTSGSKAASCGLLASLAAVSSKGNEQLHVN